MAIVYKSIKQRYDDVSGKIIAGTENVPKLILACSKNVSGATNQSILAEELLADKLNRIGSTTYDTLTMNPDRGRFVMADNGNAKAYNLLPDIMHPNKTRGINFIGDTAGGYVSIPINSENSVGTSNFCIGMFQRFQDVTSNYGLVSSKADSSAVTIGFDIEVRTDKKLRFRIGDGTAFAFSDFFTFSENTNYFILLNFVRNDKVYFYVNGVLVNSLSISACASLNLTPSSSIRYFQFTDLAIYNMKGIAERFIMFNYAISSSEIALLWNNGRPDKAILPNYMKWGSNSEKITNGTFESASNWAMESAWSIDTVNKKAVRVSGAGSSLYQDNVFVNSIGKRFKVTLNVVDYTSGALFLIDYNGNILANFNVTGQGTYTATITWLISNSRVYIQSGSPQFIGSIANVSVVQIGAIADYKPDGIVQSLGSTAITTVTAGTAYEVTTEYSSGEKTTYTTDVDGLVGSRFVATIAGTLSTGRVKPVIVSAWNDASTNALNATVTGEPAMVNTKVEDYEGKGISDNVRINNTISQTTASPTIVIDAGRVPEFFSVKNNHSSSSMTIKLGTTAGASDVVAETTITAGKTKSMPCSVIEIDESASKTLYVTATTVTTYDTTLTTRGAR